MGRDNESTGLMKKSFSMFFDEGEIWFEHLGGIYGYTERAIEKLENDFIQYKQSSTPSLIAINLEETLCEDRLTNAIVGKLLNGGKRFTRVVFVGADRIVTRKLRSALFNSEFAINFMDDFEKAKEWLVEEN